MTDSLREHFRKLERLYRAAPINAFYEPELKIAEGAAELSIEIVPKMHHAVGAAHGSVYFKALDDSAFFAANSIETDVFLLTTSFHVHLIRPVSEGRITAYGRLTGRTGRLFFADSRLEDSAGNVIGTGSGTFMRSKLPLDFDRGYA
ncbi:MAG: thioesterase [Acidobacteria bacterium]|nr:thioesterase [Acidobacteriota bacterium]NIM61546.1 thioesterase [Acidobacteriota bacterium]NIO60557.1 thioesterase [Acidobacteriota bacterium]NIQ31664.1 thioesterase [Acidobacteriota bacterium]NIQ86903.1 thioesterase [Acidobacteriota bacterium]